MHDIRLALRSPKQLHSTLYLSRNSAVQGLREAAGSFLTRLGRNLFSLSLSLPRLPECLLTSLINWRTVKSYSGIPRTLPSQTTVDTILELERRKTFLEPSRLPRKLQIVFALRIPRKLSFRVETIIIIKIYICPKQNCSASERMFFLLFFK